MSGRGAMEDVCRVTDHVKVVLWDAICIEGRGRRRTVGQGNHEVSVTLLKDTIA